MHELNESYYHVIYVSCRPGSSNHSYYVCMSTQVCVVVFTEDVFCALGAHHSHVVLVTPFIMIWFVVLSGALQQTHFSVWSLGPGRLTAQTHRHLYNQCLHFIDPVGMCLIIRLCQLRSSSSCTKTQNIVQCRVWVHPRGSRQREWKFEVWNEKQSPKNRSSQHSTDPHDLFAIQEFYRRDPRFISLKKLARRPYL